MNSTSKKFFEDHPKAECVLEVGSSTFLQSQSGAADEFAERQKLDVVVVKNPLLDDEAAAEKEAAELKAKQEADAKAAAQKPVANNAKRAKKNPAKTTK